MSDEYEIDDAAADETTPAAEVDDGAGASPAAEPVSMELSAAEQAKIAELDEALEKFEGQKRRVPLLAIFEALRSRLRAVLSEPEDCSDLFTRDYLPLLRGRPMR